MMKKETVDQINKGIITKSRIKVKKETKIFGK